MNTNSKLTTLTKSETCLVNGGSGKLEEKIPTTETSKDKTPEDVAEQYGREAKRIAEQGKNVLKSFKNGWRNFGSK
jgi:hypothetical protein